MAALNLNKYSGSSARKGGEATAVSGSMAKYSTEQYAAAKAVSIEQVLSHLGYSTSHTTHGFYYNPFNQSEASPSLEVTMGQRYEMWHLWSSNYPEENLRAMNGRHRTPRRTPAGIVTDLVMFCRGCSEDEAVGILLDLAGKSYSPSRADITDTRAAAPGKYTYRFERFAPLTDTSLIDDYGMKERGIFPEVLKSNCEQGIYSMTGSKGSRREYSAIAFRNIEGGGALRNAYNKRSTGGACSFVPAGSRPLAEGDIIPSSDRVRVFEGFFDYLSRLCMENTDSYIRTGRCPLLHPDGYDAIVMNSTANAGVCIDMLKPYETVILYLDMDDAGIKTSGRIIDERRSERGMPDDFTAAEVNIVRDLARKSLDRAAESRRNSILASRPEGSDATLSAAEEDDLISAKVDYLAGLRLWGPSRPDDIHAALEDGQKRLEALLSEMTPDNLRQKCSGHGMTDLMRYVFYGRCSRGGKLFDEAWSRGVGVESRSVAMLARRGEGEGFYNDVNEKWKDSVVKVLKQRSEHQSLAHVQAKGEGLGNRI